ncbi:WD40-repeat-containing domain protein [Mycena maculata]|uniref:WD40-repeat-containing domain protein n=1 Tax=Mycena maculata TaxID=230809 RepID=A0AAD7JJ02_9AGAR|nr:WD40-repeat-containing domain protein [Mycena maculata]
MASGSQNPIDVDALDNKPFPKRPDKPKNFIPIVISDDEESEAEVAAKLESRNTKTRSISTVSDIMIIEPTPPPDPRANVINLVSDDEEEVSVASKPASAAAKDNNGGGSRPPAVIKTEPVASSSQMRRETASTRNPKPKSPENSWAGPSGREKDIRYGPPSTIIQNPRPKMEEVYSDGEESYENMGTFYPFRHPTETPEQKGRRFELRAEPVPELLEPVLSKKRSFVDISTNPSVFPTIPRPSHPTEFIWDILHGFRLQPPLHSRPRCLSRKRPRLIDALDMDHYCRNHEFRRAGGSINKILQHDGRVVICSNTAGGNDVGDTDPYNKTGTLISFCKRDPLKILDLEQGEQENLLGTHFSVHNIVYDPVSNILASSSADKNVRTWKFEDNDDDPYSELQSYRYQVQNRTTAPHDLTFKPGESILAVGEQRLTIEDLQNGTSHVFDLTPDKREQNAHVTGAIVWGSAKSSDLIFALSEPLNKDVRGGCHNAFDTKALRTAFRFDAPEAGDALCVDPTGDIVALVTNDGSDSFLRIYDVRRQRGTAVETRPLETFTSKDHEVNSMAFSSDSLYLAVGRDDNCTHVYDSRMLGRRGVLFSFRHSEIPSGHRDQALYGVVGVEWVESRFNRLGLVTGGNDGCIRLWDPLCGDEGQVLAQAHSDVAYFTLGDQFKGEHRLVVGDSAGTVYVMDGHANM